MAPAACRSCVPGCISLIRGCFFLLWRHLMLTVHMIGNAHLDPVWLWRWQQGADEALATFRSAADRCEEYPEFVYTRGEAWLILLVEGLEPGLFTVICRL